MFCILFLRQIHIWIAQISVELRCSSRFADSESGISRRGGVREGGVAQICRKFLAKCANCWYFVSYITPLKGAQNCCKFVANSEVNVGPFYANIPFPMPPLLEIPDRSAPKRDSHERGWFRDPGDLRISASRFARIGASKLLLIGSKTPPPKKKHKTHKHFSDALCASQGQSGQNGECTVQSNSKPPVCNRDDVSLCQGRVPFVPGRGLVCPGHCPAQTAYVYCFLPEKKLGVFQRPWP